MPRGTRPGTILVYYDTQDARRASVVPPDETVASYRIFVAIGVVLGLLGAGILAWGLRERRRAKAVPLVG